MKLKDFLIEKKREGMKYKEIADKCGYKPQMISDIVNRGIEPSIITIEKIAKGFNLDIGYFLSEDREETLIPTPRQKELLQIIGDDEQLLTAVIESAKKEKLYLEATREKKP